MFKCDRCGKRLDARYLIPGKIEDLLPVGGKFVLPPFAESLEDIVLCYQCANDRNSCPWWSPFGFESDEGATLAVRYDANFPPEGSNLGPIPNRDRCWN